MGPVGLEVARKTQGKGHERDCTIPVGALHRYCPLHLVLEILHIRLQDNSQMYEQWLALKREEDRKIRSSLTHKLGTVPLLHVVCYLLILAVYLNLQWVFFSPPYPRSCQCSSPD